MTSKLAAQIATMRQEYEAKYGVPLTVMQIRQIAEMERQEKICAVCKGAECKKRQDQWYRMEMETMSGRLYIKMRRCAQAKPLEKERSEKAGIPQCYASRRIEDYQWDRSNADVLDMLEWYRSEYPSAWLYIYGGCGVGKTATASLLGNEMLRQGHDVIFREQQTLLEELKSSFHDGTETTSAILKRYATCEVLIIDDVGMGLQSSWGVGIMEQIINERYKSNLRTHLTTNYSFAELRIQFSQSDSYAGARIISRLAEKAYVMEMTGADRRWARN